MRNINPTLPSHPKVNRTYSINSSTMSLCIFEISTRWSFHTCSGRKYWIRFTNVMQALCKEQPCNNLHNPVNLIQHLIVTEDTRVQLEQPCHDSDYTLLSCTCYLFLSVVSLRQLGKYKKGGRADGKSPCLGYGWVSEKIIDLKRGGGGGKLFWDEGI